MKRKVFNFSLMASVGLLAFGVAGLSACNETAITSATVSLNKNQLTMQVGDSFQLKASVSKGYSGELRWFTSNDSVAYVSSGYVFALGEGEATITAAFGGGFAECKVAVESGGVGPVETEYVRLNPTSQTVNVGSSFSITASVMPADTTLTWTSNDPSIAEVNAAGLVTGVAAGSAVITALGSNGKSGMCNVTVRDASEIGYDIAVDSNLGYSGSLRIGSPKIQVKFMNDLLIDFNKLTNSNISFTVVEHEEDAGVGSYSKPDEMPAVFPYASDQTLNLYQFKALSNVIKDDYQWIKREMGDEAYEAARLNSVVGYPFASDNGAVMFYNKANVSDPSKIETLQQIFDLADERGEFVNYSIGNGFFAAGALMTYAGGQSLYKLTPTNQGYKSTSSFKGEAGLKAAKLIRQINENDPRNAADAPTNGILVTITDVSKARAFKAQLGDNYGVAPLPYVDDSKTIRLGSYLGYKFYGVNNQLSADDKVMASAVARFLCSEYAQAKRFDQYGVKPTLLSLQDYAKDEPHVAALVAQKASNSTIPLTAIASELWSATATAVGSIKSLPLNATDEQYNAILEVLDSELTK